MSLLTLPQDCLLQILTSGVSVKDVLAVGCSCKYFSQLVKDDNIWRDLAEKKWGRWVPGLAPEAVGGWKAYALQRMNTVSLRASPLELIQEQFRDPWQHLACCILCSRTTGGRVVREAILALLAAFPTPSAMLDAPKTTLWDMLRPLGLQAVRYSALKEMSRDFLEKDWEDPQEFKGCGKFTSDSWRIFCRGHRSLRGIEDPTLLRYLRWLTKGVVEDKQRQQRNRTAQGAGTHVA
ncbi:hypothetical protein N2152v2_007549 [Parachlorella kessleri]